MTVRIMQHCFGKSGSGGPVVAFERLLTQSALSYGQIVQKEPAGGLDLGLVKRFVFEIRQYRPELIHVRGLGNEGFHAVVAAKLACVPNILVSIHGTHRDLKQTRNRLRSGIVTRVLEPLTMAMATHIATVCDFAASRSFLVPYKEKLAGIVPNGVYIPDTPLVADLGLRARWDIPASWPLAICVSRITDEKGYPVLAQALNRLDGCVTNFALLIVGGGDENGRIQSLFVGLKNIKVVFAGHQKDVSSFLVASDFFLFPSLHENLSNALIEAMAQGLPAIASDVGGNTEVLQKGGGVLVPVDNAVALADAISSFLSDPDAVKRMGAEARENVRRHYSVERMVAGWEGIYQKILKGEHGNT